MSVRVRFAPSPTGDLHVGGARTALFNYLFAKKHKGVFIVRIEDTDQDRNLESAIFPLLESLQWLGLDCDEGLYLKDHSIQFKGAYAPYRQKDRLSIYKQKALELIKKDKAYYCFMTPEQEAQQKQEAIKEGLPFKVSSPYRDISLNEAKKKIENGINYCIRFKVQKRNSAYKLKDLVRGDLSFPQNNLGDFILIRSDGFPVYNFSCAVDDSLMEITHVFRGEEHLSNSLKQQLIQQALGFKLPEIGHLSIILDKDKKKLSKRSGAASVEHYKKEGYLPSALINFLSLLGWNPKTEKEFFNKQELIENFNLDGLNSSAAVFDEDKLLWLNGEHIKLMTDEDLVQTLNRFLKNPEKDSLKLKKAIVGLRSNFKNFKQSAQLLDSFFNQEFIIQETAKEILSWETSKTLIENWYHFLLQVKTEFLSTEDFKNFQSNQKDIKGKKFFKPIRCACMGQEEGVEIKLVVTLLSREKLIHRAKLVLDFLTSS